MFRSDFPGRSIFCSILQNSSPLVDSIDLGDGITASYDLNIKKWLIHNPSETKQPTNNLLPYISWKTRASIKLTIENSFWAIACKSEALNKIGELDLINMKMTIPWIKFNNKYFFFFQGIRPSLDCYSYGSIQVYMPNATQSIELKIDPLAHGCNLTRQPDYLPEFMLVLIYAHAKKTLNLSMSKIHRWKIIPPVDRKQIKMQDKQPVKRGMVINNRCTIYERDPSIITSKDEIANTRTVIRELIQLGFYVGLRDPKAHWFYFREDISSLKFGATDDELTICYYLSECPPYIEPLYRTGEIFEIAVVDADVKNGINGIENFVTLCKKNSFDPYKTLIVLTPSGGIHFIFKYPKGYDIQNSASKILENVDIRANDGVAGAPGYIRKFGRGAGNAYMVINDVPPIDYPGFLIPLTRREEVINKQIKIHPHQKFKPQISHRQPSGSPYSHESNDVSRAALDELAIAAHIITTTLPGSRNDVLYRKAFRLGCMVSAGKLPEELVISQLKSAALECGLEEKEILPTINSGLNMAYAKSYSSK